MYSSSICTNNNNNKQFIIVVHGVEKKMKEKYLFEVWTVICLNSNN